MHLFINNCRHLPYTLRTHAAKVNLWAKMLARAAGLRVKDIPVHIITFVWKECPEAQQMQSHMAVQAHATLRNEQVEFIIDFALRTFVNRLYENDLIVDQPEPKQQIAFLRDDCSDRVDHYVTLELARPVNGVLAGPVQLWAQTTCYKGNMGGKPEPNKTYEIRETLVEALGLRRWLRAEGTSFRTLHFTVGPSAYTYGWFKDAKDNAFDLSIYPDSRLDSNKLFAAAAILPLGAVPESAVRERLAGMVQEAGSVIGVFVNDVVDRLYDWFMAGMPVSNVANQQADLLDQLRIEQAEVTKRAITASCKGGAGIKPKAVRLLSGGETEDPALARTVARLVTNNPFLSGALEALADWPVWSQQHFTVPSDCGDIASYIRHLWQLPLQSRLISRRLLLRIHTDQAINYVQDLDIPGVDEHNLYAGEHPASAVTAITQRVNASCSAAGILTPEALYARLVGSLGRRILSASRRLESVNGTALRPAPHYVEEVLSDQYVFTDFHTAALPEPVAYHAGFSTASVGSYENMKVIQSRSTGRPLAIIKAKYFRKPEFPRRAKEEAYVALTTRYTYADSRFHKRYVDIPLIMFVDMDEGLVPPAYAVRRLSSAGWDIYFSIDDLRAFLERRDVAWDAQ